MVDWKKERARPLKEHLVDLCISIKEKHQTERYQSELKEYDIPQYSEKTERIRRNLLIIAGITAFYKYFDLSIRSIKSPFGVEVYGLEQVHIDTGLYYLVLYLTLHFLISQPTIHARYLIRVFRERHEYKIHTATVAPWRILWLSIETLIPLSLGYLVISKLSETAILPF